MSTKHLSRLWLPEGNYDGDQRRRGLETHRGPRAVLFKVMDELLYGAFQLEPGSGEGRHGNDRKLERA